MFNLTDLILDETIIEIVDPHGCGREVPLRQALLLAQAQALASDKTLNLSRNRIPFKFILLPELPQTADFCRLAQAIRDIASFDVAPDNQNQGIWMRCVQFYWQAKSILLPNKIFKLIPDPTLADGYLSQIIAPQALANLLLETDADKALYDLLSAGESEIISWAKAKGIDYPFNSFQELFIYILKDRFLRSVQEEAFNLAPSWSNKRAQKEHYCRWLKFLSDIYSGEAIEKEYCQVLMDMGWSGYPLLALRSKKTQKPWKQLWKSYLKTHRAAVKLIDSNLYWKNSIPYQTKQTNQRLPIQGVVTDEGYFDWVWR